MTDSSVSKQVRDTVTKAKGMITYFEYPSQSYTINPPSKITPTGKKVAFQVDFSTKNDAQLFVDSVATFLLAGSEVIVLQTASGTFQVVFDP